MLQRPTMLMRAILAICGIDICILYYRYHFIIQWMPNFLLVEACKCRSVGQKFPRPRADEMEDHRRTVAFFSGTRAATVANEIPLRNLLR